MSSLQRRIAHNLSSPARSTPPTSKGGTDDEYLSDDNFSIASNETADSLWTGISSAAEVKTGWLDEFKDTCEQLFDLKRSGVSERESLLVKFIRLASLKYVKEHVDNQADELITVLARIVRSGRSERETVLGAKALSIMGLTCDDSPVLTTVSNSLRSTIRTTPYVQAKAAIMLTLSLITFLIMDDPDDITEFLLEVFDNDGFSIEAGDDDLAITAAIECFTFLITNNSHVEHMFEASISALIDKLNSAELASRVAAGEAIALMFSMHAEISDSDDEDTAPLYHDIAQLTSMLANLSTTASKRVAKQSRQKQRSAFREILATIESPLTAHPQISLRFGRVTLEVDTWSKLVRLQTLRRVLTHGLHTHVLQNPTVMNMLEFEGRPISSYTSDSEDDEGVGMEMGTDDRKAVYKEMRKLRTTERKEGRLRKSRVAHMMTSGEVEQS